MPNVVSFCRGKRHTYQRRTVIVPVFVSDHLLMFAGKRLEFRSDDWHRSNLSGWRRLRGPTVVTATRPLSLQCAKRLDSGSEASHSLRDNWYFQGFSSGELKRHYFSGDKLLRRFIGTRRFREDHSAEFLVTSLGGAAQ